MKKEENRVAPPRLPRPGRGPEDDYRLDQVAIQFGSNLNDHGVDATVVIEPGRHDWAYWRRGLLEIAEWHGRQFAYD